MAFTTPLQIQPRNLLLQTEPVERGIGAVGNALAQARERENMAALGQAAQSGGLNALQQAAYGQGKIGMGMQAGARLDAQRRAQAAGSQQRVMNVGGNLVSVGPDGQPKVLYSPPVNTLDRDIKRERLKQLRQGKQQSPLDQLKAKLLQQLMGGQPGAAPQPGSDPNLRLQSNEIEPGADPNLIRTQTAEPGQAAPQGSPLDGLTPEQKRGMALNMISPGLGTPLMNQAKQQQFGKPAVNTIEKGIVDSETGYGRLKDIVNEFKPEFLTFGGGLKGSWTAFLDKVRIGALTPSAEQEQYIKEYATFKQSAWDNANRYIKEITGAQMSEAEASRLLRALPDPGKYWYDGDGPAAFKAKLVKATQTLTLARMRYHFMRSGGWNGTQMSPDQIAQVMQGRNPPLALPKMQGIFNKRVGAIKQSLRQQNPRIDKDALHSEAKRIARQEFGI